MKQGLLIAAFSLMSAVAVAGWMRHPAPPTGLAVTPAAFEQPMAGSFEPGQLAATTATYPVQQFATPAYARAPVYRQAQPVVYRQATPAPQRIVRSAPVRQAEVKRPRPFSHSAAIVAGGAGAGAAIGALAGGGKGAAIGALAGGAAGLVYDRVTAKRGMAY